MNTTNVVLNSSGGVVGQRASVGGYSPNYKFTLVEDWTLSPQQQLASNLTLLLNYSGSAARHLPIYNQDINRFAGDMVINNGTLTRLNPNFGAIQYDTSDSNSTGNYGSAELSRTLSLGLELRGIYVWGKALDILSTSGSLDSGAVTTNANGGDESGPIIQNGNYAAQRGRVDFDIHQQFSADGTWTVPNSYRRKVVRDSPWRMAVWRRMGGSDRAAFLGLYECAIQSGLQRCR
jgi:hypothetical protein